MTPILASARVVSETVVDERSIALALLCSLLLAAASPWFAPDAEWRARYVRRISVVLAAGSILPPFGLLGVATFDSASDFVSWYALTASGAGLGLSNFHYASRWSFAWGIASVVGFGSLVAIQVAMLLGG